MLIDEVKIKVSAGNGGQGAVAFNKNLMSLGPAGGSGGRGGSVYAEGVSDLTALNHFRNIKAVKAENGRAGRGQFCDGSDGEDAIFKVPVGTVLHNLSTNESKEVTLIGEKILLAKGGRGGKGNFLFRSPHDTSPKRFQFGTPGEDFEFSLELRMIADVGLIGFPNAGKSSLLNALTAASAKVANYPFTTLEPNLGVYYDLILADIPGLIEGASGGKGLGVKFLRHVKRAKILFHLIASDSDDVVRDYSIIRKELGDYDEELLQKPEYVFLSKSDLVTDDELKEKLKALKKINHHLMAISIIDDEKMADLKKLLAEIGRDKMAKNEDQN